MPPFFSLEEILMTEFYLIRHGKTVFNQEGRFQGGKKDSALLKQSIEDAKKAGEYLKGTHFEAFFSSPMGRSKQTGKAVLEGMGLGDVSIGTIEGLREFDFGNWDGDLVSEHEKSSEFETFFKDPENFVPIEMQGEDYHQFVGRIQHAAEKIHLEHPNGKVLIFAHALVNTFLVKTLLGENLNKIRAEGLVDNTSLCILKTNDFADFKLKMWNNTDYLK